MSILTTLQTWNPYLIIYKQWRNYDNNPTVVYQLGKTIRNKVFNYKGAVNSIYVDEGVSSCLNTDQCGSTDSSFCDLIISTYTGDLQIIKITN